MKKAIDAIHKITSNRLIFVDRLDYGRKVLLSFENWNLCAFDFK